MATWAGTRRHAVIALFVALGVTLAPAVRVAQAVPPTPVSISIKAENLEGTSPLGGPVTLWLNFDVYGNDVSALEGDGKAFGSSGAHIEWALTGSMSGDVVTLTGVATDSNNPALIGMPGSGWADAATGTVRWTWTLTDAFGPYAGLTGYAQGDANVDIKYR